MNIRRKDILEALGISTWSMGDWLGAAAVGFGVGALVGAGVALMLAPARGSELRDDLLQRGRRVMGKPRDRMDEMQTQMQNPMPGGPCGTH